MHNPRIVRLVLVAFLAVGAAAARADDFRVQAQLSYEKVAPDTGPDADILGITGTYFFAPVPTDGVPVGEAAYIARSSYVDVSATQLDFDGGDAETLSANVGVHIPRSIFFVRAGVSHAEFSGFGFSADDTSWNGTLGIVPIPRLFFGTSFSEDGYDPNLTARYVGKLASERWYAAGVTVVDPDVGDTGVGIEFDYYFPTFKLGGGFSTPADRFELRAERGLPNGFALLGRVYTQDGADGFGLTLTWRDL